MKRCWSWWRLALKRCQYIRSRKQKRREKEGLPRIWSKKLLVGNCHEGGKNWEKNFCMENGPCLSTETKSFMIPAKILQREIIWRIKAVKYSQVGYSESNSIMHTSEKWKGITTNRFFTDFIPYWPIYAFWNTIHFPSYTGHTHYLLINWPYLV